MSLILYFVVGGVVNWTWDEKTLLTYNKLKIPTFDKKISHGSCAAQQAFLLRRIFPFCSFTSICAIQKSKKLAAWVTWWRPPHMFWPCHCCWRSPSCSSPGLRRRHTRFSPLLWLQGRCRPTAPASLLLHTEPRLKSKKLQRCSRRRHNKKEKMFLWKIWLFSWRYVVYFLCCGCGGQQEFCVAASVTGRRHRNEDKLNRRCVWVRSPGAASDSSSFPSSSSCSSLFCCRVSWWHTSNAWPTVRTILMAWDCSERWGNMTACVCVCARVPQTRKQSNWGWKKERYQNGKDAAGEEKRWKRKLAKWSGWKKWVQREDVPPPSPAVAMMNWPVSKGSDDRQRQTKVCCICTKEGAEASHQPQDVVSLEFNYLSQSFKNSRPSTIHPREPEYIPENSIVNLYFDSQIPEMKSHNYLNNKFHD